MIPKSKIVTNESFGSYIKLKKINFTDVKWTEGFWADKFEMIKARTLPAMWKLFKDPKISHAWQNFLIASGLQKGEFRGAYWVDGDFYKCLEATAYIYAVTKDEKLNQLMDEVIDVIAKAQQSDGYIHTAVTIGKGYYTEQNYEQRFEGLKRFEKILYHELYCMGHLLTAACAHYRCTGKTFLLNVAVKTGDYLYRTFKERKPTLANFGFNPSYIMGAVELFRTTGKQEHLKLAKIFLEMRGLRPIKKDISITQIATGNVLGGTDLTQDRVPFREEEKAVGHAVTAGYLYCGAADIYAETGNKLLWKVLDKIWQNLINQKMYITGGTAAIHTGVDFREDYVREAFGREYELPNSTAYNETCANIANAMWNWRMLQLTGDAKYADIMELVLYNSALSGISLDGRHFFYTNPLRRLKGSAYLMWDIPKRQEYLPCFCCPPSISRTIAKVQGWAYNVSEEGLWFHIYGSNKVHTQLADGTEVQLTQKTNYPWDGQISIIIEKLKKSRFSLMLRIPYWADKPTAKVNGRKTKIKNQKGYININRIWTKGDVIELNLPMDAKLIQANPMVEETIGQIAVKRGPIVYCLESKDLPGSVNITEVIIPSDIKLTPIFEENLLGGVVTLNGEAYYIPEEDWSGKLYKKLNFKEAKKFSIKLIPYYAWANRGKSEMTVWLPWSM
jgi:DUF1680 family protein